MIIRSYVISYLYIIMTYDVMSFLCVCVCVCVCVLYSPEKKQEAQEKEAPPPNALQ